MALALVRDMREHRAHPPRPGAPRSLTARPDPLHLALVFGLCRTTARRYAPVACGLPDGQPAEGAEVQHYAPGGPGRDPGVIRR